MADPNNPYGYNQQPHNVQPPIWPPPPTVQTNQPGQIPYLPFLFLYNRVTGNVSDMRQGVLGLFPDRLEINGKAKMRQEILIPILVALLFLCYPIAIVTEIVLSYAFLQPMQLSIDRSNITEIVFESRRRKAGIAFNAPNYKGKVKAFSLCVQLAEDSFPVFAAWANYIAPDCTHEGRLKSGTSPGILILAVVLLLVIIFLIIFAVSLPATRAR